MNIKKIYLFLIILLFASFSFAMEGDLNDLSWLEIAQMELDNASKKKEQKPDITSDSVELFKRIPKVAFKDIKGDIPEEITRIVHKIKNRNYYQQCGLDDTAHEVLLVGPPGTGKSSLAEAIATETGRDFYKLPASSLITSYQGSGSGNIKAVFEHVRKAGRPSVIFIDEVDGISNSDIKSNSYETDRTVKELQVQLDEQDPLIICVLATNNFEQLSGALKDRFAHKTINVPLPNYGKRLAILKYYAENRKLNVGKDFLSKLAKLTDQLSCRNLEKLSEEAFNIAFEQQFDSIKKTLDKEKEPETQNKNNQLFEINDVHYLVATYTTQNTKLPSLAMRVVLLNYFFKKKKLGLGDNIKFLAKKTESFLAKDIKAIVDNIRDIVDENKWPYCLKDIYAGLYYDQTINFADSFMRRTLFEYYLNGKSLALEHCTKEELCSVLAYYTEDNFTGREISEIVNIAIELAELENSNIKEKHLIIGLYKELMKKAKPYVISSNLHYHCRTSPAERVSISDDIKQILPNAFKDTDSRFGSYAVTPLIEEEKAFGFEYFKGKKYEAKFMDYRTKLQPTWGLRFIILQYFLEEIPHGLSINQINSLAKATEGYSWYLLKQIIKQSEDCAIAECCEKLQFKHLINIAYEFNIDLKELDLDKLPTCIIS